MKLICKTFFAALVIVTIMSVMPDGIPTVLAHHSGVEFDTTKTIELNGTIKEFQFKNPHTWIQVMVPNAKGEPVEWSLEWGSPNALGRDGVRPTTFPVGAKVTVRINPMKNGSPAGQFIGAKLEGGKTIGNWN
jgi:Family of unknown function (DUF6152)